MNNSTKTLSIVASRRSGTLHLTLKNYPIFLDWWDSKPQYSFFDFAMSTQEFYDNMEEDEDFKNYEEIESIFNDLCSEFSKETGKELFLDVDDDFNIEWSFE